MLVNLLLEIRGKLILAVVKLQLRLIIIIVVGFLCCVLEIKRYIF
jgi:hypothetical protein